MQWTFDYLSEVLQNACFRETKTIAKFACTLASLWQQDATERTLRRRGCETN